MKSTYNKPYILLGSYSKSAYLRYDTSCRKTNSWYFKYGRPIPKYPYDLQFGCEDKEEKMVKWDILNSTFGSPIVNQKVLDILNTICPDDFQVFPAVIRNYKPRATPFENRDYFVLNITRTVDTIDREKSKYEESENSNSRIYGMKRSIFKENSIGPFHLARDKFWDHQELISLTLVKALKKEKVRGGSFYKDEDYGS